MLREIDQIPMVMVKSTTKGLSKKFKELLGKCLFLSYDLGSHEEVFIYPGEKYANAQIGKDSILLGVGTVLKTEAVKDAVIVSGQGFVWQTEELPKVGTKAEPKVKPLKAPPKPKRKPLGVMATKPQTPEG